MSEPAPVDGGPDDQVLWDELAEVSARINRHPADLARRLELYEDLVDRGNPLQRIADVASTGRDQPLTFRAVSFSVNKARRQREGTWPPKPTKKTTGRKRARTRST
jgi:hypothetical protein